MAGTIGVAFLGATDVARAKTLTLIGFCMEEDRVRRYRLRISIATLSWLVLSYLPCGLLFAQGTSQQFRIETEVFAELPPRLVAKSLTLFDGVLVYDFLMTPDEERGTSRFAVSEVVVFEQGRQKITLLDQVHRQRLELGQAEILSMVASMQASETLRSRDLFLLEPKLTESYDLSSRQLELSSSRLNYRVTGQENPDRQLLTRYYQFADWAARLNVTDSRKLPPFARLQLNQAMKRRGWIPSEVNFDLTTLDGTFVQATAKHHTLFRLSENDRQRIDSVEKQLKEFPEVNLIRYRNLTVANN